MNERDNIINFLLGQCDNKQRVIDGLQKQVADLQKQLAPKAEVDTK